jgi:hypothetical protein
LQKIVQKLKKSLFSHFLLLFSLLFSLFFTQTSKLIFVISQPIFNIFSRGFFFLKALVLKKMSFQGFSVSSALPVRSAFVLPKVGFYFRPFFSSAAFGAPA